MNQIENTNEEISDIDAEEIVDRKNLAVIAKINSLELIPGKDRIEFAKIEGWTAVVQKPLHQVGDLVLVVRYDSVVPNIPMFDFMEQFKFRVKVKKFNGNEGPVYSQVIVIPLSMVKDHLGDQPFEEGQDLTDTLGVIKYIPQKISGRGSSFGKMRRKGFFPTHLISKTDEINGCSKVRLLEELKGKPYVITVKCDGSSLTAVQKDLDLLICSRNNTLIEDPDNAFWQQANRYNLKEVISQKNPHIALQGELCGPKIQENRMKLSENDLYIFNVYSLAEGKRQMLDFYAAKQFCEENGLKQVPVIEIGENFNYNIDQLIAMAAKLKYANGGKAEGIVIRPITPTYSAYLKSMLSFKILNPEYKM